MANVIFTTNLKRHVDCPDSVVAGATVGEVFDALFVERPRLRGYVVDERGALRKHMAVFVNGQPIVDRLTLADAVAPEGEIYVMQALSGGRT